MPAKRFTLQFSSILLASMVLCFSQQQARAATLDVGADHVLGQAGFTAASANQGGTVSASGLNQPVSLAVDRRTGRIWVTDTFNHRVLSFPASAAMANGQPADFVLGQPNFVSNTPNNGGVSASSLNFPTGVAVDPAGNVFVSDSSNNRVLMYRQPLTTDAVADVVIGQTNFTAVASGTTPATLNAPGNLALDQTGRLFVADFSNNRVLAFTPAFANGMSASLVLGQANFTTSTPNSGGLSASSLLTPQDLTFDASNNLYVADQGNHRVLRYDAGFSNNASATRVYGQGGSFTANTANNGGVGPATLNTPRALSLDPFNNLYIADSSNNRVVQYNSGVTTAANRVIGQPNFTTVTANTGGVHPGSQSRPVGMTSDNAGNLLVADFNNNRVLEYDLPIASSAPTVATLFPAAMAAGSADFELYVSGANFISTSQVRVNGAARPTAINGFTTLSGTIFKNDVASAGFSLITVSTPAPGGGVTNIFPLSIYSRIPNDTIADRFWGQPDFVTGAGNSGGVSAHSMSLPHDVTIDKNGRLWVADFANNRVLSWSGVDALTNGKDADLVLGQRDFISSAPGTSATSFIGPVGILVDAGGNVYVADQGNSRVLIFNNPLLTDAIADAAIGQPDLVSGAVHKGGPVSASALGQPYSLALDAGGSLYVADFIDHRVLRFAPPFFTNMNASQVFGQPNFTSSTANNGGAGPGTLSGPVYVAFDSQGNLFVADFNNSRVLEYDNPAATDTVADRVFGQANFTTVTPNTGGVRAQSMNSPGCVALDAAGNLYVADTNNHRVLQFNTPLNSNGTANRVFGQDGSFTANFGNNGGIGAGTFVFPTAVTFDAKGNVYICDFSNSRILSFDHPVQNPPVLTAVAQAVPSTVIVGQPVNFTVVASDAENDALTFVWDFGDSATGTGAAVSHIYQVVGTITAKVTVTDGFGGTVSSTVVVTVNAPPNNPPVLTSAAQATPNTVLVGQSVNFTVAASDPDNDALDFVWDFGDASNGVGASINHVYLVPGTMMATVTIDDGRGGVTSSSVAVTVNAPAPNNPPVLTQLAQATPSSVLVSQTVNFTAAGSDPDNDALNFVWDFGDGTSGSGPAVSHAYLVTGTLTAKVTLDDGRGGMVSSTVMVTVKAAQPLGDVKLSVKLNFAKPNADAIAASGALVLAPGDLTGKVATVQIADLIETFTIGKSAKNADGTFGLSSKGVFARTAKFKLKLGKKTFVQTLASAGFVNASVSKPVQVPVTLTLDGTVYQTIVTLAYTGTQGKSGKTK